MISFPHTVPLTIKEESKVSSRSGSPAQAAQGSLPLTLNRKTMVGQPHRLLQWKKVITQQTFSGDCFCRRLLQTEANRAS